MMDQWLKTGSTLKRVIKEVKLQQTQVKRH